MKKSPLKATSGLVIIENFISKASGVSVDDIRSRKRDRFIVDARVAVWFVCHDHFQYSYLMIGRMYDRDHSVVLHGVKRFKKMGISKKIINAINEKYPYLLNKERPRTVEDWDLHN